MKILKNIGGRLNIKILTGVLFVSGFVTLIITAAQVYWDYSLDIQGIESRISQIENSYIDPIANSLWEYNLKQVEISLEGIKNIPDIEYVNIVNKNKILVQVGSKKSKNVISKTFPLVLKDQTIGELTVVATFENAVKRAKEKIIIIFISQAFKTFITSFCIVLIIQLLVTRHVLKIVKYFKSIEGLENQKTNLKLSLVRTHEIRQRNKDEIDELVSSINFMMTNLEGEFGKRKNAEKKLTQLNVNLENIIEDRTKQLLETNKLAALGEMAGGVAHEINTPLSVVYARVKKINKTLKSENISDENIFHSLENIISVLDRIFTITNGLRYFAVDSVKEPMTKSNLNELIKEVIYFCQERYRSTNVKVELSKESDEAMIFCKSKSLGQALITLVKSSITSAAPTLNKWVLIKIEYNEKDVSIIISDSALKTESYVKSNIENPFSTSTGVEKGSGLELGMIKGIIELHNGNIWISDQESENKFIIKLPIINEEQTQFKG
jgi:C4-dicarboxylate-specific signal transduction histidine kinase